MRATADGSGSPTTGAPREGAERSHRENQLLLRRARRGDHRARQRLVEKYLPLADKVARRYRRSNEPLDDLVQVARVGLVKAIARWDPDRGTLFSTYAVPTMTGELRRYFRDSTWAVRPPRALQELCLKVGPAREALAQELGREPTAHEVASRLGRDVEQILEAMAAANAYWALSLDGPARSDDPERIPRRDLLVDPGRELGRCEDAVALEQLSGVLSGSEQEILRLRVRDDLLQREIAARVGCSQMHVSRVLRDAVRRMRTAAGVRDAGR